MNVRKTHATKPRPADRPPAGPAPKSTPGAEPDLPMLVLSTSPHVHGGGSVARIMRDVLIALSPVVVAACVRFEWDAPRLIAACVGACLGAEWLCRKLMQRPHSIGDCSAAVTGLLLALNLPPGLPTWMAVLGSVFAIVVAKQVYGGLGYNPFNPALVGRAFLLISFTAAMTTWTDWASPVLMNVDMVTTATPLELLKESVRDGTPLPFEYGRWLTWELFAGRVNGSLGETSSLAILLGGLYLLARRVISWHVPVAYLGVVALGAAAARLLHPAGAAPVAFHLFSGGLMLGAWFMATDMVTTPLTRSGLLIFGAGCGVLTLLLRWVPSGAYPEGVSFAILIMNAFTPLLNRWTRPQVFGTRPRAKHP